MSELEVKAHYLTKKTITNVMKGSAELLIGYIASVTSNADEKRELKGMAADVMIEALFKN